MRKVVLYIAMSLDGYIADKEGNVSWLKGQEKGKDVDTYSDFIKNIDTVLMGRTTYDQVVNKLSPTSWPYQGLKTYVFTHQRIKSRKEITFTAQDPVSLIEELMQKEGKDIWICGGANLITQLITQNLIDEYDISIIPTILGDGIGLFNGQDHQRKLNLEDTKINNGIVELIYKRR
ncbi:MAG: dihydrofolate reductase family protein [Lactobacillus sp.]|nr:dihydrofolate reductase family protein [Lactobacillus sp.]